MNASRVDHPRTSPVALRTNTARSTASPPDATVAMLDSSSSSPTGQDEVLHFLLLAVEVDHDPEQLTLFVRAPRVDAQRLAEPVRAARLVDVAVQGERRLVALEPTGTVARPASLRLMSAVSCGASSSPVLCGGQCRLKIVRSGSAVISAVMRSIRSSRTSSSSSRYVSHGVRLAQPLDAIW